MGEENTKKRLLSRNLRAKKIDGYLIPIESLQGVMKQKIDAVRAYVGINDQGEQTLMLVGTAFEPKDGNL